MAAEHLEYSIDIVTSFVSANKMDAMGLPDLIRTVHNTLANLEKGPVVDDEPEKPSAAQIRSSITPEALISFINGKPYKTLKRHVRGHGLTLEAYKARYGLPRDYPSVAANYRNIRSKLAKNQGRGSFG
jgi:predicted transcriptional regulator